MLLASTRLIEAMSLDPKPKTLNSRPYTLDPRPYTLDPTPYTLHPRPYTLDPESFRLHDLDTPRVHPLDRGYEPRP
jgi:hypothetical protein